MITALHVIIAIASIVHLTYTFTGPTRKQLYVSYGMVSATLASGVLLVATAPSHMVQACTVGVVYLAVMSLGIIATNVKLARVISSNL
jgi:hypothetical protein